MKPMLILRLKYLALTILLLWPSVSIPAAEEEDCAFFLERHYHQALKLRDFHFEAIETVESFQPSLLTEARMERELERHRARVPESNDRFTGEADLRRLIEGRYEHSVTVRSVEVAKVEDVVRSTYEHLSANRTPLFSNSTSERGRGFAVTYYRGRNFNMEYKPHEQGNPNATNPASVLDLVEGTMPDSYLMNLGTFTGLLGPDRNQVGLREREASLQQLLDYFGRCNLEHLNDNEIVITAELRKGVFEDAILDLSKDAQLLERSQYRPSNGERQFVWRAVFSDYRYHPTNDVWFPYFYQIDYYEEDRSLYAPNEIKSTTRLEVKNATFGSSVNKSASDLTLSGSTVIRARGNVSIAAVDAEFPMLVEEDTSLAKMDERFGPESVQQGLFKEEPDGLESLKQDNAKAEHRPHAPKNGSPQGARRQEPTGR